MISRPNRNDFRRMGLYFRENYKQGEPVDVSIDDQEWNGSWIKWYESRLEKYSPSDQPDDYSGEEFDNTEVSGAIIPPDPPDRSKSASPPRIRLREKGKNAGSDNLHPGHLEFKVFLQKGVEDGLSGRSSPRILHRKEGEIVRDKQESRESRNRCARASATRICFSRPPSSPPAIMRSPCSTARGAVPARGSSPRWHHQQPSPAPRDSPGTPPARRSRPPGRRRPAARSARAQGRSTRAASRAREGSRARRPRSA